MKPLTTSVFFIHYLTTTAKTKMTQGLKVKNHIDTFRTILTQMARTKSVIQPQIHIIYSFFFQLSHRSAATKL